MCGFIGGTDPDWRYGAALDAIAHRGPDSGRMRLDDPVKVGFRRLSIIDLDAAADQPMLGPDGASWIVFNGEIYGFRRLRADLETRGHTFRTQSDTEVALVAYFEWGDAFVEHIDGMFAIAIWDARTQQLKLLRDRPGIKPLYYYHDGRRFAFASELKAIEIALARESLEIDGSALYDFLSYRYVPAPKTLYRHCHKLPPAHRIVYDAANGRLSAATPFWRLDVPDSPHCPPIDAAAEELRALIDASVADQMIADVPLGFFLSGGVDSSAVVASAARQTDTRISTFAIGFDSDKASETPYARAVAERFGTDHVERILSRADAHDLLPMLKTWFDEPFADESAMPTWLVAKTAREHVKVVLTGDGGDEVFGGYRTYPRFIRYDGGPSWPAAMDRLSYRLRRPFGRRAPIWRLLSLLEMRLGSGPALWGKIMSGMPEGAKLDYRRRFELPADYDDWWHFREHWRPGLPARTRLQFLDFHTFMPGLVLAKVDRTTMAVSLEARVPLLDRRIVEFSFSIAESLRYHDNSLKGLFRHAYRGILPDHILDRRKKGFGIPRNYFTELEGEYFQEHVLNKLFLNGTAAAAADAA